MEKPEERRARGSRGAQRCPRPSKSCGGSREPCPAPGAAGAGWVPALRLGPRLRESERGSLRGRSCSWSPCRWERGASADAARERKRCQLGGGAGCREEDPGAWGAVPGGDTGRAGRWREAVSGAAGAARTLLPGTAGLWLAALAGSGGLPGERIHGGAHRHMQTLGSAGEPPRSGCPRLGCWKGGRGAALGREWGCLRPRLRLAGQPRSGTGDRCMEAALHAGGSVRAGGAERHGTARRGTARRSWTLVVSPLASLPARAAGARLGGRTDLVAPDRPRVAFPFPLPLPRLPTPHGGGEICPWGLGETRAHSCACGRARAPPEGACAYARSSGCARARVRARVCAREAGRGEPPCLWPREARTAPPGLGPEVGS